MTISISGSPKPNLLLSILIILVSLSSRLLSIFISLQNNRKLKFSEFTNSLIAFLSFSLTFDFFEKVNLISIVIIKSPPIYFDL